MLFYNHDLRMASMDSFAKIRRNTDGAPYFQFFIRGKENWQIKFKSYQTCVKIDKPLQSLKREAKQELDTLTFVGVLSLSLKINSKFLGCGLLFIYLLLLLFCVGGFLPLSIPIKPLLINHH